MRQEQFEDKVSLLRQAEELAMEISRMYTDPEYAEIIKALQAEDADGVLGLRENQTPGGKTGVQKWYEGQLAYAQEQDDVVYYRRLLIALKEMKRKIENY